MILIRTKNLSPLFSDVLGLKKFLSSMPGIGLMTSPGDGIDWELSGALPEDTLVYSLIPHTIGATETADSHKLAIGIPYITPLYPVGFNYKDLPKCEEVGLYGVTSIEDLYKFEEDFGKLPDIVRLSINPLKYPRELLSYCKEKKILVIGTDIFGEEPFREYYRQSFPEEFLQAFGENNSSILEIPGDDPYFIKRVYSRLGQNLEDTKLLEYSRDIDKVPILPSLPKVSQITKITVPDFGEIVLSGDTGEFTLKEVEEKIDIKEDPIWEDTLIPEDVDQEDKELMGTLHRYHVLPTLLELHPRNIWRYVFTKVYPDFWVIKVIPRKWMGFLWKEHLYWMISGKLWKMPVTKHENLINKENI